MEKSKWWFTLLVVGVLYLGYQWLVEIPQEAAQKAQEQINLERDERSLCVTIAENTAVAEYKDSYCWEGNTNVQCTNGTYLTAQYDTAYTHCLQRDGLQ